MEKEILVKLMKDLQITESELRKRVVLGNPMHYGLPDLLFGRGERPGTSGPMSATEATLAELEGSLILRDRLPYEESTEQYEARQNQAISVFVEKHLWVFKDDRRQQVRMTPEIAKFIADMFYLRTKRAILWKPRGGGGSLSGAIVIWMLMVYRQMSVVDVAGSQEQARVVYNYVKAFWDCVPGMRQKLLAKPPTMTETQLVSGTVLKCIPATEKQVRGKHFPVLVADETCQGDEATDRALRAAMSSVTSEENSIVLLLSTFHIPMGLFRDVWDFAEEKGFKRYKWDVFDCMEKCTLGMETATPEDPQALEHCKKCPLTWYLDEKNELGEVVGQKAVGCQGRARQAAGWMSFNAVVDAKKMHLGTNVFEIEYCCWRPNWAMPVYDADAIDTAKIDEMEIDEFAPKCVGVDWGYETVGSMAMVLAAKCPEYIGIPECSMTDHMGTSEVLQILEKWRAQYGALVIFADRSHPFENNALAEAGFHVEIVDFGSMKALGIGNIQRYLAFRRLKILREFVALTDQMKNLRKNLKGQVLKKSDHGCDALLCALLCFLFDKTWPHDGVRGKSAENAEKQTVRSLAGTQVSSDGAVLLI